MVLKASMPTGVPERCLAGRGDVEHDEESRDLERAPNDVSCPELEAKRRRAVFSLPAHGRQDAEDRRVDELRSGEVGDDELVVSDEPRQELVDLALRREIVLSREDRYRRARSRLFDVNAVEWTCQRTVPFRVELEPGATRHERSGGRWEPCVSPNGTDRSRSEMLRVDPSIGDERAGERGYSPRTR